MFSGHFPLLRVGLILGPGLFPKTSFFKWPQPWKSPSDAVKKLQSTLLYLLQLYLIPVSVLTDVIFICETKICDDTKDNVPCFSLSSVILETMWGRDGAQ